MLYQTWGDNTCSRPATNIQTASPHNTNCFAFQLYFRYSIYTGQEQKVLFDAAVCHAINVHTCTQALWKTYKKVHRKVQETTLLKLVPHSKKQGWEVNESHLKIPFADASTTLHPGAEKRRGVHLLSPEIFLFLFPSPPYRKQAPTPRGRGSFVPSPSL